MERHKTHHTSLLNARFANLGGMVLYISRNTRLEKKLLLHCELNLISCIVAYAVGRGAEIRGAVSHPNGSPDLVDQHEVKRSLGDRRRSFELVINFISWSKKV